MHEGTKNGRGDMDEGTKNGRGDIFFGRGDMDDITVVTENLGYSHIARRREMTNNIEQ